MSDDKKIIFSMSGLSKTFSGESKPVLKNIYLSFFYLLYYPFIYQHNKLLEEL